MGGQVPNNRLERTGVDPRRLAPRRLPPAAQPERYTDIDD